MKILNFSNLPDEYWAGLELLSGELNITEGDNGVPISVEHAEELRISWDGERCVIVCREKAHFFRGLTLFLGELSKGKNEPFYISETPAFDKSGAMFDVSRNAVLKPESVEFLLRKMARMGMNAAMLYTEDTYELQGYPYFGYQRGAYSAKEIKRLDDYADALGIELIPCIQTLGHLGNVLKWEQMGKYADTAEVLLCDDDEVYRFIEDMLVAASSSVRSKRIHIGMDEAMDLGLGRFLQQHNYEDGFSIITRHFNRVTEILERLGLTPYIWSDMYFRLASKTRDYYDLEGSIPQEVIDQVPKNMNLVYWDYYHSEESFYAEFIERHQRFSNRLIFAGGLWTWVSPAMHYGQAFQNSIPALKQCRNKGVREVFVTMWGDDGAESSLMASLLGLQLYAEYTFADLVSIEKLSERFACCTGESADAFLDISRMDHPGEKRLEGEMPGTEPKNYSRILLYSDPLLDLFAKDLEGIDLTEHYQEMTEVMKRHAEESRELSDMFSFYTALADFLSVKCNISSRIREAYTAGDRTGLKYLESDVLPLAIQKVQVLRIIWRKLWFKFNKPFGFEVIDIRLGGVEARLDTAANRLRDYLEGSCSRIEELEKTCLPMGECYQWRRMVSASRT